MTERRSLSIDDLPDIPVLSDPQLSPNGQVAAYVVTTANGANDRYTSIIWAVPTDAALPPRPVTTGPRDTSPRWSPNERVLAFVADGEGSSRLYVWPLDATEATLLCEMSGGITDPQWSPDSTRITFTTVTRAENVEDLLRAPHVIDRLPYKSDGIGMLGDRRTHVFVVDVVSGAVKQLTEGDFSVSSARWSPEGDVIAYAASVDNDHGLGMASSIFLVPAGGGSAVALTPPDSLFSAPTWFPDGQQLLVFGQERLRAGHNGLFALSVSGGTPAPVASLDRNVVLGNSPGYPGARPHVDLEGRVLFMVRDRGTTRLYCATPSKGPHCIVGEDTRSLSGLSVVGDTMAYLAADNDTTGELCIARLDGSNQRQLTQHFSQALPNMSLARYTARTFAADDGTQIQGWILRSSDTSGASPLLLDIHGGPHNSWGPALDAVHVYHHELVARGWTVLMVNPRGSDGYGEAFFNAAAQEWGFADEQDFLEPVNTLIREGIVDPGKVVVTGYSYGGYMTCWLSARQPARWAAAIAGGVVTDLVALTGTSDLGSYIAHVEFGTSGPGEDTGRLRASSPLEHVQHVTTPTLILQGEQDERCPVSQAEMWFTALRLRHHPVTLVRFPGASHDFPINGLPTHRQDWCRRIADFATQYGS